MDRADYLHGGLTPVDCGRCAARFWSRSTAPSTPACSGRRGRRAPASSSRAATAPRSRPVSACATASTSRSSSADWACPMGERVRVVEVIEETPDAKSFVLDLPAQWAYRPGQFLTVRVGEVARCYSLCSSPLTGEPPKITVKRVPDGHGSNWLCDNVSAGSELELLAPGGVFTPGLARQRPAAARRRKRDHPDHVHPQVRAAPGHRERVALSTPTATSRLDHLRRRAVDALPPLTPAGSV